MSHEQAVDAFVALGSNLDDPERQVRRAFRELAGLPNTALVKASPLYLTAPLGPAGQADYVNAVVKLRTTLTPLDLLDSLQELERRHGRARGERWGARTLDLDLLLYAGQVIDHPRLKVPHPRLHERRFVLQPLFDVDRELRLPDGDSVAELLKRCPAWEMRMLAS